MRALVKAAVILNTKYKKQRESFSLDTSLTSNHEGLVKHKNNFLPLSCASGLHFVSLIVVHCSSLEIIYICQFFLLIVVSVILNLSKQLILTYLILLLVIQVNNELSLAQFLYLHFVVLHVTPSTPIHDFLLTTLCTLCSTLENGVWTLFQLQICAERKVSNGQDNGR